MSTNTVVAPLRMMTRKEVAEMLHLSLWSLDQMTKRGEGPQAYRISDSIRFIESEVVDWIRSSAITAESA